jgi:hypothetical protein
LRATLDPGSVRPVSGPADKLIANAAKTALAPLGLVRKRRSRTWIDDHGWWLINVEFQPSSYAKGCYLNIGTQHLWVTRGYLCLDEMERPLGGATFVSFTGDEDAFATAMCGVAATAAEAVEQRRRRHGEGRDALIALTAGPDDLDAGIAATLLGDADRARVRFNGRIHPAHQTWADEYSAMDADAARARASQVIAAERTALRLPHLPISHAW